MAVSVVLPEPIYERVRAEARRHGRSVSEFVVEAVENHLQQAAQFLRGDEQGFDLPSYHMGTPRVDINRRVALDEVLEGE